MLLYRRIQDKQSKSLFRYLSLDIMLLKGHRGLRFTYFRAKWRLLLIYSVAFRYIHKTFKLIISVQSDYYLVKLHVETQAIVIFRDQFSYTSYF